MSAVPRTNEVPRIPLLIGGKLVQSKTSEWRDIVNPATQDIVARVPFATRDELDLAVGLVHPVLDARRRGDAPAGAGKLPAHRPRTHRPPRSGRW